MDIRACGTKAMLTIQKRAKKDEYNRFIPQGLLDKLDPDGIHVMEALMHHTNAQGVDTTRVNAMLKIEGQDLPFTMILDVNPRYWRDLPKLSQDHLDMIRSVTSDLSEIQTGD